MFDNLSNTRHLLIVLFQKSLDAVGKEVLT